LISNTCFVHETAWIDADVRIGRNTRIWHFSHVMPHCSIGENCVIGQNACIGPGVTIGSGVKIQNNVSVYEGVTLEDHVFCGPSVVFTNVLCPRSEISRRHQLQKTLVRRGATLGANATILCGLVIGRYAFIGAGAVVTQEVPDHALIIGNPGRLRGWVCRCGLKLRWRGIRSGCACGDQYLKRDGAVRSLLESNLEPNENRHRPRRPAAIHQSRSP
jgi:UDP-2-acetamido-3-amino-2,3-dideoxy-glucuronate N-acetyltransferase